MQGLEPQELGLAHSWVGLNTGIIGCVSQGVLDLVLAY